MKEVWLFNFPHTHDLVQGEKVGGAFEPGRVTKPRVGHTDVNTNWMLVSIGKTVCDILLTDTTIDLMS